MEAMVRRLVRLYGSWNLVALGLLGVCGTWLCVGPERTTDLVLALGAGTLAALLLAAPARRDPYPALVILGIAAGFFLALGMVMLSPRFATAPGAPPTSVLPLSVVSAALLVLSLGALWRLAHGRDGMPNPLVERFGWKAVREVRGIQVALEFTPAIRPGDKGWVRVHLLNAWDAPREVMVHCVPKGGLGVRLEEAGGNRFEEVTLPVQLAPFEIGSLALHVAAFEWHGGASSPFPEVLIAVIPSGKGGRRVRLPFTRRAGVPRLSGEDYTPDSGFVPFIRIRADAPASGALPPLGWRTTWSPPRTGGTAIRAAG